MEKPVKNLNLNFLGWPYGKNIKIAKMTACSEDFLCGDDFDAVLAIFRSYSYSANGSEGVKKIATDEEDCPEASTGGVL